MWRYLRSTEAAQEARRGSHLFLIWFDSGHGGVSLLQSCLKQLLTFILYQSFASACVQSGDKHIRGSVREKKDRRLSSISFVCCWATIGILLLKATGILACFKALKRERTFESQDGCWGSILYFELRVCLKASGMPIREFCATIRCYCSRCRCYSMSDVAACCFWAYFLRAATNNVKKIGRNRAYGTPTESLL